MAEQITLHPDASRFGGTIPAIASKSFAHRLILLASLSDAPTKIICPTTSKDIEATIQCMTALGADIRRDGEALFVTPIDRSHKKSPEDGNDASTEANANHPTPVKMDAGESGSTLRFLLPILGVLGCNAEIRTAGRLASRPLSPLKEEMAAHGTDISVYLAGKVNPNETPDRVPANNAFFQNSNTGSGLPKPDTDSMYDRIPVSGKMEGGSYTIAGNISSQFITGLLLALPLAEEDSTLTVTGKLESRPYVDITLACLREAGITIREESEVSPQTHSTESTAPTGTANNSEEQSSNSTVFHIPGRQKPHCPETLITEGDWSNAAFFLAAGALSPQGVTVTGLNPDSCQGDKEMVHLLQQFGAEIASLPDDACSANQISSQPQSGLPHLRHQIRTKKAPLRGLSIDAANIPDLVPILAAVAAAAEGTTVFRNIERLRIKESDRVATVIDCITSLGGEAYEENDTLIIRGTGTIRGGTVDSHNDHRIAMTAAILSLISEGPVTITDAGAVKKSYPGFYEDFLKLENRR